MRARYYDPEVGRFVSEDPIGFEGGDVNLYAYVGGNPVLRIDPLGTDSFSIGITLAAGAGVGGGGGTFLNFAHDSSKGWLNGWSFSVTGTAEAGAFAGVGGGVQFQATTTNAAHVSQLNGEGLAFGKAGGVGVQGGVEYVTNIGGSVSGLSAYLGLGIKSIAATPIATYAFGTTTSPIVTVSQNPKPF